MLTKEDITTKRAEFDSHVDRRIEPFADYFDSLDGMASMKSMIDNLFSSCHIGTAMLLRDEMREMDINLKADISGKVHALTCATANIAMLFAYATDEHRKLLFMPVHRYVRYACVEGLHEANKEERQLKDLCAKAMNLYVPEIMKALKGARQ